MTEKGVNISPSLRIPARVLASLNRNTFTVILHPETGLADGGIVIDLPLDAVPPDLRMPNSEFDVISDWKAWDNIKVVRKDDLDPEVHSPSVQ